MAGNSYVIANREAVKQSPKDCFVANAPRNDVTDPRFREDDSLRYTDYMKIFWITFLILTLAGPLWVIFSGQIDFSLDYRTANRESTHIAPDPLQHPEAMIQAYSARAFNWRGIFATHNWIVIKPKNSNTSIVYQLIGWRKFFGKEPIVIGPDIPDRSWFGQKPHIYFELTGKKAEELIPKVDAAARSYPYADIYGFWPGPNSNTFPAYIARQVPELGLALPSTAIGKDFLPPYQFFARAPSGTGYQFSLFGFLGILIAKKEGIEINLLGLVYGIRFHPFAILLPGIGNIPNNGNLY